MQTLFFYRCFKCSALRSSLYIAYNLVVISGLYISATDLDVFISPNTFLWLISCSISLHASLPGWCVPSGRVVL
ncbi:hypothetical protein BD769DRAFT_1485667 [Suillus cothurnatus]|nr:hypothetical protein BD769DRAFT_1485667 [Suillus cothurnatus]